MRRREVVSSVATVGALALGGCADGGSSGCSASEVLEVGEEPATITTPTPGRDDTPTPVSITEDYVVVTVRNDAGEPRHLAGYVVSADGRREFSRTVPAEAGTVEFRFGPFGHHTVQDYEFRFEGC